MAAWVVGVILREEDLTRRTQTVANLIRTAEHLIELQNFNGVMQMIASLCVCLFVLVCTLSLTPQYAQVQNGSGSAQAYHGRAVA